MRSIIEAALLAILLTAAFFAVLWAVQINEELETLRSQQVTPRNVSIKFNSSTADVECVMKGEVCDARFQR